jgi:uncharacterized protein
MKISGRVKDFLYVTTIQLMNTFGYYETVSSSRNKPQFLVDENLAGMARWLRYLGFDTVCAKGWSDIKVAEHARTKGRILLTRDRELASAMKNEAVILIATDSLAEQLIHVLNKVGKTEPGQWFQLCTLCNEPLRELFEPELQAEATIPDWVKAQVSEDPRAWRCEKCERAYWKGSHYERTYRFLDDLQREISILAGL